MKELDWSYLLNVDAMAGAAEDQARFHCFGKALGLDGDFFLILPGKVDKMVILGSHKEWNRSLVESTTLSVPFLDRVQCAFAGKIEHEQDSNSVITHKRQHVHKLALAT